MSVESSVVLDVLNVPVAVTPELAACFAHLRRSYDPARFTVEASDPSVALAELTRIGAEHSPLLCMHAGVVAGTDGMIAVPGHSGLGKTTLVAALVQRGFGYVSDECLAVDLTTGLVEPFARPLGLAAPAWPVLGLDPHFSLPPPGGERLFPPDVFGTVAAGPGRVNDIVLVHREPGEVRVARSPRGAAVSELLHRSFNHYRSPEPSFHAAVALVRGARVWQARYENASDLASALASMIARY